MQKKYGPTGQTMVVDGRRLHQIVALRDFGDITAGTVGGHIETEFNLSHAGTCWVTPGAYVLGNAQVLDDAQIRDEAQIREQAVIRDEAVVEGNAILDDGITIEGAAEVFC